MSNTKFNKLNKAELIDMLCMNQNLLKTKEETISLLKGDISLLKEDLNEANRQNSQLQESIDDLTTQKFEALEQVKEFKSKLVSNKKRNNTIIVILIIALIVAIIL